MIRQVRLPSLKICTLLLVLLFFYDIFFVFITPFFTKVIQFLRLLSRCRAFERAVTAAGR